MTLIGELSLWIALLMAAWATAVSSTGSRLRRGDLIESGRRALHATATLTLLAAIALTAALLSRDFALAYVVRNTGTSLPAVYALAAFWAEEHGAILLWTLFVAMSAAVAVHTTRSSDRSIAPHLAGIFGGILLISLAILIFAANPFERLEWVAPEGQGLEPRLRHPGMVLHPPVLSLGLAVTAVPFALVIAAMLDRRIDRAWSAAVRRWSLFSWCLTSFGILLGMWWAYSELGWIGSWMLAPFLDGSLLPWVALTASIVVMDIRDDPRILPAWGLALAAAPFFLAVSAAFVASGGIVAGDDVPVRSAAGEWFGVILFMSLLATAYMFFANVRRLDADGGPTTAAGALARLRRWIGIATVVAGAGMIAGAMGGNMFRRDFELALRPGEQFAARDPLGREWRLVSQGLSTDAFRDHFTVSLSLDVSLDGEPLRMMRSERRHFVDTHGHQHAEETVRPDIVTSGRLSTYLMFAGAEDEGADSLAHVRISFVRYVVWLWIGGVCVIMGGLASLWPRGGR